MPLLPPPTRTHPAPHLAPLLLFFDSCAQSDSYWYSGQHCEQSISKVGVAVGVALGLAALLLLILLLAVLLCWRRCRPKDR